MKTLEIIVFGKVQGVWYRKYTKQKADELSIVGAVQNMADGSVRIHAWAETTALNSLVDWCKIGSTKAEVSDVKVTELEPLEFYSFEIIR
jgi:acylphosphatase